MLLARGWLIVAFSLLGVTLVACGGGEENVRTAKPGSSMSQELLDLERAYRDGLIDESQYDKAKRDLVNRYK